MTAPAETLPVFGGLESPTTQYGSSLVQSSTAPMRLRTPSRAGRTDTGHDVIADLWILSSYADYRNSVFARGWLNYAWPGARLLETMGVCQRITSSATSAESTPPTI